MAEKEAYFRVGGLLRRRLIALLIRAIANWLVPEGDPDVDCIVPGHGRYLYELLMAEADRAEAGG
jgi:hypothetical protein